MVMLAPRRLPPARPEVATLAVFALGAAPSFAAVMDITNERDEHPDSYIFWDKEADQPVQFWEGNYDDIETLSCHHSSDLLFDWSKMKRGMASWLKEVERGSNRVMQTYWELIRPVQHSLTNIVAYHNFTTGSDCMIGLLSVRFFYLTAQSERYRQHQIIEQNSFLLDWHYVSHRFGWGNLVQSGWGHIVFSSLHLLANSFAEAVPWLSWVDCEELPGVGALPETVQEAAWLASDAGRLAAVTALVDAADEPQALLCPVALTYLAVVAALGAVEDAMILRYLDRAQSFIRWYREKNNFTFINLLNVRWPLWHALMLATTRATHGDALDVPMPCGLVWCPEGGTPNVATCACEVLFPDPHENVSICFFMVDTRRTSSLRNITSVLNARFWTLAYGINRLYAEDHGYEIEYVKPNNGTHFPERKVGWGKVKVIIDKLRLYGSERCAYGVSIDTDAFMRTSEPLAAAIRHYDLDRSKLILFSQEYHTELRPGRTFINGGFFIVRNSNEGVGLLEEWYNVPDDYEEMAHLKTENPQGLNLCWDEKMQPRHADSVVLGPSRLFAAPLGVVVRHNWFKDLNFEQEMQEILLQRLRRKYGCIVCNNVYDWDDSLNHDVGPQR